MYVFGMPMKDWQQRLMTVADTKTLWEKDPDKRNPCSTSICLNYSHFRVQFYLHSQFLHIFVWTIKTTPGGGHFHKTYMGHAVFQVSFFSIKFLNLVWNRMFPHAVWLNFLFELLSKVESTQEGHHKLTIPAYSRE